MLKEKERVLKEKERVLKEKERVLKEKEGDSASAEKVQRYKFLK